MPPVEPARRVRLEYRATEVAVLSLSAAVPGIKMRVSAIERTPMQVTADGHPMELYVREVV